MEALIIALLQDVAIPAVTALMRDNPGITDAEILAQLQADAAYGVKLADAFLAIKAAATQE